MDLMDEEDDEEHLFFDEKEDCMEEGSGNDPLLEGAAAYPAIADFNPTIGEQSELSRPIIENGRFKNPWKSFSRIKLTHLFKAFFWSRDESCVPRKEVSFFFC